MEGLGKCNIGVLIHLRSPSKAFKKRQPGTIDGRTDGGRKNEQSEMDIWVIDCSRLDGYSTWIKHSKIELWVELNMDGKNAILDFRPRIKLFHLYISYPH